MNPLGCRPLLALNHGATPVQAQWISGSIGVQTEKQQCITFTWLHCNISTTTHWFRGILKNFHGDVRRCMHRVETTPNLGPTTLITVPIPHRSRKRGLVWMTHEKHFQLSDELLYHVKEAKRCFRHQEIWIEHFRGNGAETHVHPSFSSYIQAYLGLRGIRHMLTHHKRAKDTTAQLLCFLRKSWNTEKWSNYYSCIPT